MQALSVSVSLSFTHTVSRDTGSWYSPVIVIAILKYSSMRANPSYVASRLLQIMPGLRPLVSLVYRKRRHLRWVKESSQEKIPHVGRRRKTVAVGRYSASRLVPRSCLQAPLLLLFFNF